MSEDMKQETTSVPAERPAAQIAEKAATPLAEKPAGAVAERPAAELAEKPSAAVAETQPADGEKAPGADGAAEDVRAAAEAEAAESRADMDEPFDLPEAEMEVDIRDDRDDEAESLVRWAAARAAIIVVAPVLGTAALMANEVYMISRIGQVYGVKLSRKAVLSFLGALGGTVAGSLAATLIPLAFMQVPIAVGVTYGLGKAAQKWIKDGMPDDVQPYRDVFEKEKKEGEAHVDELKDNPQKDTPLGDESVDCTAEEDGKKPLYPDEAHEAFDRLSDKLSEAAGLASARFIEALKKAGVTDEQIEQAKYTAIGVSEVAKETARDAAKDFSAQAKVKSKELAAQAKVKSKELSRQAREKSKELSAQAKEQMEAAKAAGRKLRLEADIRAAEARVKAEQAKAEARIRMARARVKAAYVRAQAEEQKAEVKARAEETAEKAQERMKEARDAARKTAGDTKDAVRAAAEDFRTKVMERADQRRAEDRARRGEDSAPVPASEADQPVDRPPVESEK